MTNRKKIVFIVNPISGTHNKKKVIEKIQSSSWFSNSDIEVCYTEYAGHAFEIAKKYTERNFDIIVAVGGDGTVNEIARALIHANTALCIIPMGSGNGLARDLKIPLKAYDAMDLLQNGKVTAIDVCYFNDQPYFCTAGVGYDAATCKIFVESHSRGFFSYLIAGLKAYIKIKPVEYKLTIDGNETTHKAIDIIFANARQFGNNAYVSPVADLTDELIDVVVIRPFPWYKSVAICIRLFRKTLHKSQYVEICKCKHVILERPEADCAHFDGESTAAGKRIEINIKPSALKVLVKE
ncbi:MAG: diacylglycerol kinase family lipid kinase [Prevotellaceae bacterium]|jgi:YegS/Rv2252/BmrU family lipid kinase|nr:diacylglycerol kinase family lipid kinase [Prevotellaceae bacterium]